MDIMDCYKQDYMEVRIFIFEEFKVMIWESI